MNLNVVSKQWASRPDDQRFLTMNALLDSVLARRHSSQVAKSLDLETCAVRPVYGSLHLTQGDQD
jgi:hypothetical protein